MASSVEGRNLRLISAGKRLRPARGWHAVRRHLFVYLGGILFPLVLYAVFIGYPIADTIFLSLNRWNGLDGQRHWIGLENFQTLLQDPKFFLSLGNNVKWAALTLLFPVFAGLLLAVLLFSGRVYFASVIRSILFLPSTMSLVTIGIMFSLILNSVFGVANETLRLLGLGAWAHDWLGDPQTALYTLIAVFAWSYVGLPLMLFYAGISAIPVELFETATLEGANGFQTLRYITIPLLTPVTTVVVMLTIINSLRAFDLVMAMTRGGPFNQTSVLGYWMYSETFWNYRFGYGAAISAVILLLGSIFAAIYLRSIAGKSLHAS